MTTPVPDVCFVQDLCLHLRLSRRQVERLRKTRWFPIRELPKLDGRPRFSGDDVRRYKAGQATSRQLRRVG